MADSVAATLDVVRAVLYYASWPLVRLFHVIALVLTPFWTVAQFVLLPVTYLAHGMLNIVLFPSRLRLLERLETIYIYVGIAGLIGCLAGAALHVAFNFLSTTLQIDSAAAEAKPREIGRTAKQHRIETQRKKALDALDPPSSSTLAKKDHGSRKQQGLLSQTIIEEEDSDF